jgi:hypothetical protein
MENIEVKREEDPKEVLKREVREFLDEMRYKDTGEVVGTPSWEKGGEQSRIESRKSLVKKAFNLRILALRDLELDLNSQEVKELDYFIGNHNLRVFAFLEMLDESGKGGDLVGKSKEGDWNIREQIRYFMSNYAPTQEESQASQSRKELMRRLSLV